MILPPAKPRLYRQHQVLAQQLMERSPRPSATTASRRIARLIEILDALAAIAAKLLQLQAALRQGAERMAEHRAIVAQQGAEERRRKGEAE